MQYASAAFTALWDRVAASDVGLQRLLLALRGTGSVALTGLVAVLASRGLGVPVPVFAGGVVLSMMGPFLMREPTPRQRLRTLATLVLPAAAPTVATTLLHGFGPLGDAWFLALIFVCYLVQPRSPRMIPVGLVAVVVTYVGLYLELPPATLPMQLVSILAAVPLIGLACFVLVPMNPVATLRRTVAAVQWRAARVVAAGSGSKTLQRDLARLNEAVLAADDLLMLLRPDGRPGDLGEFRRQLIHLETLVARLIVATRAAKPGPRLANRLALHARRVRQGRSYTVPHQGLAPGSLLATLVELGHVAHALGPAAQAMRPAPAGPPAPAPAPGPLAWRLATRVTLAGGLAMAGGMALSPQRWFWAVLTVYVVFLNARSRGDTIYRGLQRLGGTLLGIGLGLVLATLLSGDTDLEIAALLASVFGMFYLFLRSYTAGIFCVTVLLGLLYGMLGASLEAVLVLRFEETLIGAAAAIFVAAVVLPTRTRDQVVRSGRSVIAALVEAVRSSRSAMQGLPGTPPAEAMRRVDRQVADLRLAMAPLTARRVVFRRTALERPVPALLDCVHWARVLAEASHGAAAHPEPGAVVARARRLEDRLARLAGEAVESCPTDGATTEPGAVAGALGALERAVAVLEDRLEVGTLEGYALDN